LNPFLPGVHAKNGIRLSGMPAFGKVESDEHIWDLVFDLRTLPGAANIKAEAKKSGRSARKFIQDLALRMRP
jgi:hypothetical protein